MNNIAYFEIQADDCDRAQKFYGSVFGWTFVKQEGLPIDYFQIQGAGPNGGLLARPVSVPKGPAGTNAYTCSVEVESFDDCSKKILENGGIVALPKFAVPGKCWQGYFLDTEGNTFGIFQVDPKAA